MRRCALWSSRGLRPENPFPHLHTLCFFTDEAWRESSFRPRRPVLSLPFPAPSMARGGRQKAAVAAPVVKDPARYKVRAHLIALAARQTHPFCGSSCVRLNPHELLFESLPLTDRAMRYLDAGGCLPLWDQVPVCPRRRGAARPPGALVGHPAWASLLPQCC